VRRWISVENRGVATAPPSTSNPQFVLYWTGQSISLLGSQFTVLALPLTAALALHAGALDMGFLGAMQFVPALLFGPVIEDFATPRC
jgi:hypothetical protein